MPNRFSDIVSVFAGGVRLVVKAKPGLGRPRTPRVVDIGNNKRALEVTVSAAAKDGKANQAIIKQLAIELGLKKNDLAIKTGMTGRLKLIEITGTPATLRDQITHWMSAL